MSEAGDLISVVIADDAEDIRYLLRLAMRTSPEMRIVSEAANGRQAVEAVVGHDPDVVLLDISMPEMDGLEAATEIRRLVPRIGIVIYSGFLRGDMEGKAMDAGADRYLEKSGDFEAVKRAILEVAATRVPVEAPVTRKRNVGP